jgi:hypothetical protein
VSRGRTAQGRARRRRLDLTLPPSQPLIKAWDHGEPVRLDARTVGSAGERWIEPFLAANASALKRLDVRADVSADGGLHLKLVPGAHIGAMPCSPRVPDASRRVCSWNLASSGRPSGQCSRRSASPPSRASEIPCSFPVPRARSPRGSWPPPFSAASRGCSRTAGGASSSAASIAPACGDAWIGDRGRAAMCRVGAGVACPVPFPTPMMTHC